jgi:hypothetical protein
MLSALLSNEKGETTMFPFPRCVAGVFAVTACSVTGCYAHVDPEPVGYADVTAAPVDIETYPSVVYGGQPVSLKLAPRSSAVTSPSCLVVASRWSTSAPSVAKLRPIRTTTAARL